jgi:hypothetical protein
MEINWEKSQDADLVRKHAPNFASAIRNAIETDLEIQKTLFDSQDPQMVTFNLDKGRFWATNQDGKTVGRVVESELTFPKNLRASAIACPVGKDRVELSLTRDKFQEVTHEPEHNQKKGRSR